MNFLKTMLIAAAALAPALANADLAARARALKEVAARCPQLARAADSIAIVDHEVDTVVIDQGQAEYHHVFTFEFSADSLPSRYMTMRLVDNGTTNPRVDRFFVENLNSDGHCR